MADSNLKIYDADEAVKEQLMSGAGTTGDPHIPYVKVSDIAKVEDVAHSSGDSGVMVLGVRKDTVANLAGTDGDYAPMPVGANGLYVDAHLGEVLSYLLDSIDVAKMSKGAVTTAHSTIAETATSAEIDCRGFNSLQVYVGPFSAAENWTFKVRGCMTSGGTFVDWYELANTGVMTLMSHQCNAAMGFPFRGIPDYVKIVATRDGGASTVSVIAQPYNG